MSAINTQDIKSDLGATGPAKVEQSSQELNDQAPKSPDHGTTVSEQKPEVSQLTVSDDNGAPDLEKSTSTVSQAL